MSANTLQADLAFRPRLADLQPLIISPTFRPTALERSVKKRVTPAAQLKDRPGYDSQFLGDFVVPWPTAESALAVDVYPIDDNGNRLDYMHFSVTMSRSRRMALYVGVNIDGTSGVELERRNDTWAYDGRLPVEAQLGEDLYRDNELDRGHLVRRQDPNWGAEAQTANDDTFHFTNCSPQMAAFNQKTWLELEDYILDNTRRWKERVTIFTGPLLRDDDKKYRGVQIPTAYWKVVAFLGDDGKPSASAYMIDQRHELERLEFMFGAVGTYQRSVARIESLTGIQFGDLANYDGFSNEERLTGTRIEAYIRGPQDIRL
ncbi:DNA/RNA non-specific endonuclease [Pseudomonas sp. DWP3-1-2]|uniref:DNA/RNA non-specific endonuclease n=1 Tax=Pseudomonas sp. DWP3-1-2 TaxID=2804645 RepID=UPI003CEFC927